MRIEQYFLMTDYSLWEVILNGDSRVVQQVSYRSAEQKLARRNELKARGNLTQNLAFVSSSNTDSTTDSVSAAISVFAVYAKLSASSHLNINSLSNAVIYSFFSVITATEKDIFLGSVGLLRTQEGCYDWSYQAEEVPANFDLMFITSSSSSSDNELSPTKPAQDLSHTNETSAPIIEDWVSDSKDEYETNDLQIVPSFVQSSEQVTTPRTSNQPTEAPILDATLKPTSLKSNRSGKRKNRKTCFVCRSVDHLIKDYDYHAKKKTQPTPRNYAHGGNNKQNASFTHKHPPMHMVHAAMLTQSKPVSITAVRPVCAVVPKIMVTRPRHAHSIDTKSKSPIRRHITRSPSPKTSISPPRVTAAQAPVVSAAKGKKGKLVWRPKCPTLDQHFITTSASMTLKWFNYNDALGRSNGCSRHMTGNMSYLSNFEELNGGYVAFGLRVIGIAERKNRTLIEAARTILADSLLPIPFWAEAVNTTCYVQNRVLVTKPHNKTPYELSHGRTPSIVFMRPFGCPVTILNILDPLGKFERKVDEGFLVGYSINSKAFRVFNSRTRIVQETLHNKDGDAAFDGKEHEVDTKKHESAVNVSSSSSAQSRKQDDKTKKKAKGKSSVESFIENKDLSAEFEDHSDNSSNDVNAAGSIVRTAGKISSNSTNPFSAVGPSNTTTSPTHRKSLFKDASQLPDNLDMLEIEDITYSDHEDVSAEADFNNLETSITVSHIPTTRTHKDHPVSQIIGTFLGPKRVHQALKDSSWIEAMREELLQFKMQKAWILVDLPHGKREIGTKWVYKNKKDEKGIVVRNKTRLVTQGHTQEEGIDYEELFALVARIEAIRLFLAYASFMGFMVYQMDVKSAFLYGTIEEEVYVCQPSGFEDPNHLNKVYKVVKALYGLHQAPRAWG
nr:hypothetical protein [Tanacetum cinerariifolium]